MAHLLGAETLHLDYPTKTVLDSVTIGVNEGDRIGIVGRNGDGKSSLLNLLSGRVRPDGGRVTSRSGTRIGMLDQTDALDAEATVAETIVGDRPHYEWAGDPRVRDVLDGLISDVPWDEPVSSLSGGQRRRTSLAKLLVGDWDVLMLDEPTNHLDLEGITWLAEHLKRRWGRASGALLVVTHDRWFLDEVCNLTWEVHDGTVEPFEGGYAAYILKRVERDRLARAAEAKRQNLMRKELAWLRRGAPARTSKPKFRVEEANRLIADEPPPRDTVELLQTATARLGKDVVDLLDVSVSYDDYEVLHDVEWRIAPGERTGILGINGAGKSTLLNLITGEQTPTTGRVKRGKTVQTAMLTQRLTELNGILDDRVADVIAGRPSAQVAGGKELTPGQLLERLGFTSAQLSTPVRDLSGGQQRRLQLLLILLGEPNVLVLDEPTNDLDTDMLTAMEDLLDAWPGTLIVVSHDRYFLERVTDQQYAILHGRLRHLPGGIEEFLRLDRSVTHDGSDAENEGSSRGPDVEAAPGRSGGAAPSGLSAGEQREIRKKISSIDRKLSKLSNRIDAYHRDIAHHDQSDFEGLAAKSRSLQELEDEVADLETRWLQLTEELG